jgi:hypothetical protein
MKGIYIPKYKCAFITGNKSGSRALLNTFVMFFDYIDIEYTQIETSDYIALPDTKYYIMVRNPLERFFTTYNWLMRDTSKKTELEFNKIENVLKKYNIQTIEDYANSYKKLYNELEFDTHLFEQYYSFIPPPHFKNNGIDISYIELKKAFDKKFNNYQFIHIENLLDISETYRNNFSLSDDGYLTNSIGFMIDVFSEFDKLTIEQKKLSNIFYSYIIQILDTRHHSKLKTSEYRENYIGKITNNYMHLFRNELILYGYNAPTII